MYFGNMKERFCAGCLCFGKVYIKGLVYYRKSGLRAPGPCWAGCFPSGTEPEHAERAHASALVLYSRIPTRHTFPASEVLWLRFRERIRPSGLLQGLLQGLRKSSSRGSTFLSRS